MAHNPLTDFVEKFPDFATWPPTKKVDYFAYHLMGDDPNKTFSATDVLGCFTALSLKKYARVAPYLSTEAKSRTGKYIKASKGYRLEKSARDAIHSIAGTEPQKVHVSRQLTDLVAKVADPQEASFLEEAITCLHAGANRAAVVMIWILAMHHLQKYAFSARLADLNAAIGKHPDKRMQPITAYDDFSEFKETRIIELLRSAGIITNDVRKILDEKLGNRNSAGHPAAVVVGSHKATEIALDLVHNVLLKY